MWVTHYYLHELQDRFPIRYDASYHYCVFVAKVPDNPYRACSGLTVFFAGPKSF